MLGGDSNKLSFSTSTLFESSILSQSGSEAFVFNIANYSSDSPDEYILSLKSNNNNVLSVAANGDLQTVGDIYAKNLHIGAPGQPGDLAEKVDLAIDDTVEAGDVLVVDINAPDTYRRSSQSFEQAVAGVVSTNPNIVVGNGRTNYTAIMAMVGRVPVKVSGENGAIHKGDLLVTASSTGYAMKYNADRDERIGMVGVIGVALESFDGERGKVMALIRTGWAYNRNQTMAALEQSVQELASAQGVNMASSSEGLQMGESNGKLVYTGGNLDLQGNELMNVLAISGKNNKWAIDALGRFITRVDTSEGKKEMYAIQSPESEFVFSSSSQLVAGEARVNFEQAVREIINMAVPLKVSVTLTSGEAKGIYVSAKDVNGFSVKELSGGASNATFDWVVVAKRKEGNQIDQPSAPANSPAEEPPVENSSTPTNPPLANDPAISPTQPITPEPAPTPESPAPDQNINP
jgi:hypothetical protein